ncbi:dUTP diphosphatase [Pseudoteredinibacter isoporae]|uniref:dUTP diphosphatase n=1 Tax=Pseudoteredinibacter isoporae TaxID=570281 RepID=UPI003EBF75A5
MQQQLRIMLDLQDNMNRKVNDDWRAQNFEWYRAIWIECGELLDHYGWKWWKKQSPDIEQVRLELIDIWHFGLSMLLMSHDDKDALAAQLAEQMQAGASRPDNFPVALESFTATVLSEKRFPIDSFMTLLEGVELDTEGLYRSYVGKNVLNFFRQDNGYKDGSYRKLWAGREDNEHLVELVQSLDSSSASFADELYQALQARYEQG